MLDCEVVEEDEEEVARRSLLKSLLTSSMLIVSHETTDNERRTAALSYLRAKRVNSLRKDERTGDLKIKQSMSKGEM